MKKQNPQRTNIKNKQLAKKKAKKKLKLIKIKLDQDDILIFSKINLSSSEILTMEIIYKQKTIELAWRRERINMGLSWACEFDKKGNIYPVKRSN